MFSARRLVTVTSAALWLLSVSLMFSPFTDAGPEMAAFMRVASINAGALAACFTVVAVLPSLLREFYQGHVTDYVGAFLAGWAKSQEEEPEEPTRLHVVS